MINRQDAEDARGVRFGLRNAECGLKNRSHAKIAKIAKVKILILGDPK